MSAAVRAGLALRCKLFICALAASAAMAGLLATGASAGVIPTDKGPVRGTATPAVKEWLGIPYATPPVGDLRWRPPQPHARWHGPLDATHFGNHCPQTASPFGFESTTEDCLYLNVFTPNKAPGKGHTKNLPVMFWIHGGGLTVGESDDYDPTRLVEQGTVVVTVNYRLGTLGFLAHPALTAESSYHGSGDYGFMDQQLALRWVKRNIAKFGGDPGNVTIFGQSAGGLSVHTQLASPLAAGLFQRAIAQSGAYSLSQPSLASAEGSGSSIASTLGCTDQTAACLRAVPVATLLAHPLSPIGTLIPNVDGFVLPHSIGPTIASGDFNRVPVIEGSTHDEFSIFYKLQVEDVFGIIPSFFYPIVVNTLVQTLGVNASPAAIVAQYPIANYGQNVGRAVTAIGTDLIFACPGRRAARSLSQFVPTYAYEFDDPNVPQVFVPPASFPYRSYHSSELLSLFDSFNRGGHAPLTPDEEALAATMVRHWTQFAGSGSPNGSGTPAWTSYTTANDAYQSLTPPTPVPTTNFAADHKCAFWDSLS